MSFGQQNDLKSAIFEGFRGILRWALLVKDGAYRTPIAASRSSPRRARVDGGVTKVPYTFSLSTEPEAHTGDGHGDHAKADSEDSKHVSPSHEDVQWLTATLLQQ